MLVPNLKVGDQSPPVPTVVAPMKRRVSNLRRYTIDAGSPIDAQAVRTHIRQAHIHKTTLKSILRTTKCANLTALSILVDDDKRINIVGYLFYVVLLFVRRWPRLGVSTFCID